MRHREHWQRKFHQTRIWVGKRRVDAIGSGQWHLVWLRAAGRSLDNIWGNCQCECVRPDGSSEEKTGTLRPCIKLRAIVARVALCGLLLGLRWRLRIRIRLGISSHRPAVSWACIALLAWLFPTSHFSISSPRSLNIFQNERSMHEQLQNCVRKVHIPPTHEPTSAY